LMRLRSAADDWYGARQRMASASARASSRLGPVEAPVSTLTWKGRPLSCRRRARAARALGTALAAPAAVKPLNATIAACGTSSAASAAVRFANGLLPDIMPPTPSLLVLVRLLPPLAPGWERGRG